MPQREWSELGKELRSLREAQDIAQKTVVDLSGETMGERMLRSYESGDRRPSRERLLKLLVRSFQLKEPTEINRCLRLAEYAALTQREVDHYGLRPTSSSDDSLRVSKPAGPPADFRLEAGTIIVTDGQGREIWRHEFPT